MNFGIYIVKHLIFRSLLAKYKMMDTRREAFWSVFFFLFFSFICVSFANIIIRNLAASEAVLTTLLSTNSAVKVSTKAFSLTKSEMLTVCDYEPCKISVAWISVYLEQVFSDSVFPVFHVLHVFHVHPRLVHLDVLFYDVRQTSSVGLWQQKNGKPTDQGQHTKHVDGVEPQKSFTL